MVFPSTFTFSVRTCCVAIKPLHQRNAPQHISFDAQVNAVMTKLHIGSTMAQATARAPLTSCRYAGRQSSMLFSTMARTLRGSASRSVSEMGVLRYLARQRGWGPPGFI